VNQRAVLTRYVAEIRQKSRKWLDKCQQLHFNHVCDVFQRGFVCSYVGANSVVGTARISQINKDGKTQQQENP